MIGRCCRDTLKHQCNGLRGAPVVGLEIPCRWMCDCYWRFEAVAGGEPEWVHHDPMSERISRMILEVESPEWQALKTEFTRGKE